MTEAATIGGHLREWRLRRRMSQLDLALDADISARHLSFVETGRARPSRDMVLHLSEALDVPLRARNTLLLAAGYAPIYGERPLDHPDLAGARAAVETVLAGFAPFPALAIDRHWNVVARNAGVALLLEGVAPDLLAAPNAMRLALHPRGLAPTIENFAEWRAHLLARLRQQALHSGDGAILALLAEVSALSPPPGVDAREPRAADGSAILVPIRLRRDGRTLSFISTTTVFGTPLDVTLSELAIESFLPADAATLDALRAAV